MFFFLFFFLFKLNSAQFIQSLNEISIVEELPIGSFVTSLTDKIANLDQSIEYDLVKPLSPDFDLFSINHSQHSLIVKNRIDYEKLCSTNCTISVSIAVSNFDTIDVFFLPIRILNINDNHLRFPVNRTMIEINENDGRWFEKSYALPRAMDDDGDPISYSLYLQNWQKPTNLFELDEFHLRLKPLKSFDREEEKVYLLRLVAHNSEDLSHDVIVLIKDENDNFPRCEKNSSIFVVKNFSSSQIFDLNASDDDEGPNGRLNFVFNEVLPGFTVDRLTGRIRFEPKFWSKSNRSELIVNVSDDGENRRLSTFCRVQIVFPEFFQIEFDVDQRIFPVENFDEPFAKLRVFQKFQREFSSANFRVEISSNFDEIFLFNSSTFELFYNENSPVFRRILTNTENLNENLPVELFVEVFHVEFSSLNSRKNFSFVLNFDKKILREKFRRFYFLVDENFPLGQRISSQNFSSSSILIDPTGFFSLDEHFFLISTKIFRVAEENFFRLKIQNENSADLLVFVTDRFSPSNVFPHFDESFRIVSSRNLNEFKLKTNPSHVKYFSSVENLIDVDSTNGSIRILSPTLRTFSHYDFQIIARDFQTPSFSSSMSVRIFFVFNQNFPQINENETKKTIESISKNFLGKIDAFDPELFLLDQSNIFPPAVEFQIEQNEFLQIDRFSGRIFLKKFFEENFLNFTLVVTDFGQPTRLTSRFPMSFYLKTSQRISIPLVFFGTSIVVVFSILFALIFVLIVFCFRSIRNDENVKTKNFSPQTVDTRLIDHEYVATSLTRVYSSMKTNFNDQQCLSMDDINKYLERFEKIYNDSSSQQYLHQPIGSVV